MYLLAIIDEVSCQLAVVCVMGGLIRTHYGSNELNLPLASIPVEDILVRWLAYAEDICTLSESKAELATIFKVFDGDLIEYGMKVKCPDVFLDGIGFYALEIQTQIIADI